MCSKPIRLFNLEKKNFFSCLTVYYLNSPVRCQVAYAHCHFWLTNKIQSSRAKDTIWCANIQHVQVSEFKKTKKT